MKRPPRLVVRTLAAAFITVAVILSLVFIVLMVDARGAVEAIAELRRCAGTQFDEGSVEALAAVLPHVVLAHDAAMHALVGQPMV